MAAAGVTEVTRFLPAVRARPKVDVDVSPADDDRCDRRVPRCSVDVEERGIDELIETVKIPLALVNISYRLQIVVAALSAT